MTRYEAAALLSACLDRITEVTDELRRLLKEFETELAILKGRVDGLEARVGELEATQFSPPPSSRPKPSGWLVLPTPLAITTRPVVRSVRAMLTTLSTAPSPSATTCVLA
ncbi:putative porin/ P stress induced [Synechococcus sp. A15-62]|nr:putative porin/ P stress induced [Synechococcus sp. A15-62]